MITLETIQTSFHHAWKSTLSFKKNGVIFSLLLFFNLFSLFLFSLSFQASPWIKNSVAFFPFFLFLSLLLSSGVVIIRIYALEKKGKSVEYFETAKNTLDVLIASAYFAIPAILGYLLIWIFLGIFVLLSEIPAIGQLFQVFFAFAPFLLYTATLLLSFFNLSLLFTLPPIFAFETIDLPSVFERIFSLFSKNIFLSLFLFLIALLPLFFVLSVMTVALFLTQSLTPFEGPMIVELLSLFVTLIPFTALLSPFFLFFFHFSFESYSLLLRCEEETA